MKKIQRKTNTGLYHVLVEVTSFCNLRCRHCYSIFEKEKTIDMETLKELAKTLAEMGCIFVTLSGGEPLTIGKRIFSMAEIFKEKGLKVLLTTNATLFKNFPVEDFGIFDSIQISVDGPKEIHEAIRGNGTFSTAVEMAEQLKNRLPVDVCFMMTLNSLNVNHIGAVNELAKRLEVRLAVERMTGATRGGSVNDLTSDEFFGAMEFIINKNIGCTDPCWFPFRNAKMEKTGRIRGGCTAGITALAVSTDLDIYPCARLRVKIGSLKKEKLEDIWFNSEILNTLRDRTNYKGRCGNCGYVEICGGCRANAFAKTGDYLAEDPICSQYINSKERRNGSIDLKYEQ